MNHERRKIRCCGTDGSGSRYGSQAGCYEQGNEPSIPIEYYECITQLREY
jgi:hypothetical protein